MRINVYSEELTEIAELVTKTVPQSDGLVTFYGIRLFLRSPKELLDHSTPEDDDRSAITFWVRESELTNVSSAMENLYHVARRELEASWERQKERMEGHDA